MDYNKVPSKKEKKNRPQRGGFKGRGRGGRGFGRGGGDGYRGRGGRGGGYGGGGRGGYGGGYNHGYGGGNPWSGKKSFFFKIQYSFLCDI